MQKKPKLYIPGPTHVQDEVLSSLSDYPIGHRSKEFSILYEEIMKPLSELLFTTNRIYLSTSSATGLWEAAVRNSVKKKCVNFVCGAFSKKWHDITKMSGLEADMISVDLGKPITPEIVDDALSSGKYDVMTYVHNETSTGLMNPLEDVAEVMKKYPDVLFLVDAVSSLTSVKIEVDKLGIDLILASVQKGFSLPPGFSFCTVSDRLLETSKKCKNKGYYFDFEVFEKYALKSQTPSTPSIPHMYAMKTQLNKIFYEGLENRFNRHKEMAKKMRAWAIDKGFGLFPEEGYYSETLTCIKNDLNIDVNDFQKKLLEKGYMISGGYGPLKGKNFRVSHMGDIHMEDVNEIIEVMDQTLEEI